MNFVILNDVRQKIPCHSDCIHHATIRRGFKEYVVYRHKGHNTLYFEEVAANVVNWELKLIEDDDEWLDLVAFCKAAKLLEIGEAKVAVA